MTDLSVSSSSLAKTLLPPFSFSLRPNVPKRLRFCRKSASFLRKPSSISRQNKLAVVTAIQVSTQSENDGFVLEDVPHLTNFLPDLPVPLVSPLLSTKTVAVSQFLFSVCYDDVLDCEILVNKRHVFLCYSFIFVDENILLCNHSFPYFS